MLLSTARRTQLTYPAKRTKGALPLVPHLDIILRVAKITLKYKKYLLILLKVKHVIFAIKMQLPGILAFFTQLPLIVSNLTSPSTSQTSETESTSVASISHPSISSGIMSSEATNIESKKYTLPDLPYAYNALEPYISKQIMTLHHTKHHQAYVNNLNAALETQVSAVAHRDVKKQIEIQQAIKFNGGGHINHSLFWENLCPASSPASSPTVAPKLQAAIEKQWGSYDNFKDTFSKTLLGLQGSGWGWLVRDISTGGLGIDTTKDQDPVVGGKVPIFGVDMWEHAYYLQYYNDKASYVKGIWSIINWEVSEKRFKGEDTPKL